MIEDHIQKKCVYAAVLGCPNAGKSTFVNAIVGSKVSIVAPKAQTTRRRILGIVNFDETQVILIDTPGLFSAKRTHEKLMVRAAYDANREADVCFVIVDATKKTFADDMAILARLPALNEITLILNKIDRLQPAQLLAITAQFSKKFPDLKNVFMVSAKTGDGLKDLVQKTLLPHAKESPWHYTDDEITNLPLKTWAAEITREQLVLQLQHELPYETYVETESWETFSNGSVKVQQKIVVARSSQKGIILGKGGAQIKAISLKARQEMEKHLEHPVHLFLFVKVTDDWMDKPHLLQEAGFEKF